MSESEWVRADEAAEILGLCLASVTRYAKSGRIPGKKGPSGSAGPHIWLFRRADLIAFQEAKKPGADPNWVSTADAAAFLGVRRVEVARLAREGRVKAELRPGRDSDGKSRQWRFQRQSLEQYRSRPQQMPANRNFITYREAAAILNRSFATVVLFCSQGKLTPVFMRDVPPAERVFDCKRYLARAEVEALLQAGGIGWQVRPEPEPVSADRDACIWLAGFFDGEGCITIGRNNKGCWELKVAVTNTYMDSIRFIHAAFGGLVHFRRGLTPRHRDQLSWQASGDAALPILRAILPFLRVKHEQAKIAIEFQEHIRLKRHAWWDPIPEAEVQWREERRRAIAALNAHRSEGSADDSGLAVPDPETAI